VGVSVANGAGKPHEVRLIPCYKKNFPYSAVFNTDFIKRV